MKVIKYFISYSYIQNGNLGYDNAAIDIDADNGFIKNINDIRMIEKKILENFEYKKVVILNYREM